MCPAQPGTAPTGTLNATQVTVAPSVPNNGFSMFEGPVWLDGALYFSEISPSPWDSDIRKYVPGAADAELFLAQAGTNGLAVDSSGVLFSATPRKREISKYDLATKAVTTVAMGALNSPNDIAIAQDGRIYFSDPLQGELSAGRPSPEPPMALHMWKDGVDTVLVDPNTLQSPNGVTLSPADDVLYVTLSNGTVIKEVKLMPDGTAGEIKDLVTDLTITDGMTKDCLGNIYVAEHGNNAQVSVYSPSGEKLAAIKTGMANNQQASPTNVAFGGADGKTLFITAIYSLWQIELPVAGYPY
jgi:gluconolactonase